MMQLSIVKTDEGMLLIDQELMLVIELLRRKSLINWDLSMVFEKEITNVCGEDSEIIIGKHHSLSKGSGKYKPMDPIKVSYNEGYNSRIELPNKLIPIYATRHANSYSDDKGRLTFILKNKSNEEKFIRIEHFFEWPMTLWFNSIKFYHNDRLLEKEKLNTKIYLIPSIVRKRPSQVRITLDIPPNAQISIELEYELTLLKYTEYPIDPHRGFDIRFILNNHRPALIYFKDKDGEEIYIMTEANLVHFPSPDFSMPYNVITITCTLIALFHGQLYNRLTRKFIYHGEGVPVEKPLRTLLKKVIGTFMKRFTK